MMGLRTREQIKDTSQSNQASLEAKKYQKPSVQTQISELESNMREFNGKLETLEYNLQKQKQQPTSISKDIIAEIRQIKSQIRQISDKVATLEKNMFIATKTSPQTFHYLEGEDLFKKRQWQDAILAYQKYRDQNPNGTHWPDATLKIAICFQELTLIEESKAFYTELINKKPQSSEAQKAQRRLQQLKL